MSAKTWLEISLGSLIFGLSFLMVAAVLNFLSTGLDKEKAPEISPEDFTLICQIVEVNENVSLMECLPRRRTDPGLQ